PRLTHPQFRGHLVVVRVAQRVEDRLRREVAAADAEDHDAIDGVAEPLRQAQHLPQLAHVLLALVAVELLLRQVDKARLERAHGHRRVLGSRSEATCPRTSRTRFLIRSSSSGGRRCWLCNSASGVHESCGGTKSRWNWYSMFSSGSCMVVLGHWAL